MFTSYSDSKIRICYVIIKPYFSARFLLIFAYIYLGNIPFLCIRKPNYMLKRTLCLIVLALLASPFLFAQVTTSAISGSIKSTTDETLVGASVVAIHVPSGTKYVALSRAGGSLRIENMKPGGPYTIEITYVGYDKQKFEDVYLQLAETFILNIQLTKSVTTMENVVLSTGRRNVFNPNRTGPVTSFNNRMITVAPSINRNILDLTRATPQANGQAIGGGNSRSNNFTVDGADFNNTFGIQVGGAGNLPGGGSPISFDALDEVSVSIAPFDVRQAGFVGAGINAVTRSGTNNFSGSVYHYYRTEKLRGKKVEKTTFNRSAEEFDQWGMRIGGPIIKNKLFFFFSYETDKQPSVIQTRTPASSTAAYGSSPFIARPTIDSLNYISQYLLTNYGYNTGVATGYVPDIERKKYLGRIDWNISNHHRAVFRYSQVVGGNPAPPSTSVGGAGTVAGNGASRTDITSFWYKNANYFQGTNFYSLSAELNSNWGKVANVIRGTYTYQDDSRTTTSSIFPFVDIMSTTGVNAQAGSGVGAPYVTFGYEPFSYGNLRKVKVYSVTDNFTFTKGKHNFTFGGQYDRTETINGFQRFATSYYRFASWADFASALNPNPALRKLPTDFAITYSLSKDFAPAFSAFRFNQLTAYAQDEIAVNKNLRLTFGLRGDLPTYPDVPQIITHPLVYGMNFKNGEKVNTGLLPENKILWSPRIGFNWDIYGDRSLQIRGGTGVFTGRIPFVWIVSQSGDNGMIQVTQSYNMYTSTGALSGQLPPGPFNPDPAAYRPATVPAAGTIVPTSVTAMSEKYKHPRTWKTVIGLDTKLPWGMIGTIEGIFNKDLVVPFFRSPNYIDPQPLNTAGYPDNRPMYGSTVPTRFINTLNSNQIPAAGGTVGFTPVVIDNSKKGYYGSLMIRIEKPLTKGFNASIAYTKSLAGNISDGDGDQALGAYQGTQQVYGLNTASLSHASYVVPDRLIAMLNYRKEYVKHLATSISLVYVGSAAYRYSYTYSGDFNRDGVNGNDLLWIPTASQVQNMQFSSRVLNGVTYDQTAQRSLFESYIQQDKYMRTHRGQYAERNGALAPWRNQMDVKFLQDLFVKSGKYRNTLQFSVDIFNAGNLINASWGKRKLTNATQILTITNANSLVPGGSVLPIFQLAADRGTIITRTYRDDVSVNSTYQIQFGLRYIFN